MRRSSSLNSIDSTVEREIAAERYQDVIAVGQNIDSVVTVADDLNLATSNILTVASSIVEVITTAGMNTEILSLYADKITLDSLYADKATLDSLFADKATLDSLVSDKVTLDSLYADKATLDSLFADKITLDRLFASVDNIDRVHLSINHVDRINTSIDNVDTVAASITNVDTVAGSIANINTVASVQNLADITTVAQDLNALDLNGIADVTVVANDLVLGAGSSVNIVSGISADVSTVAGIASDVDAIATNILDVNTFIDTYHGALAVEPTIISHPALTEGDLYYTTVGKKLMIYNGTNWIGAASAIQGTVKTETFESGIASGVYDGVSLTMFPVEGGYDIGYISVYLNGIKQRDGIDYTALDALNVSFTSATVAASGDEDVIEVVAYGLFESADYYSKVAIDAIVAAIPATSVTLDTTNFNLNLGVGNTDAQSAFEALDDLVGGLPNIDAGAGTNSIEIGVNAVAEGENSLALGTDSKAGSATETPNPTMDGVRVSSTQLLNQGLGESIATNGTIVAVSAPYDSSNGSDSGVVYLFDAVTGAELHIITEPTPVINNLFGEWVTINSNYVFVGVPNYTGTLSSQGCVHVYSLAGVHQTTIISPTPIVSGGFGENINCTDTHLIVGSSANEPRHYVFELSGFTEVPFTKAAGASPLQGRSACAINSTHFLVGDAGDSTVRLSQGCAHLYNIDGTYNKRIDVADPGYDYLAFPSSIFMTDTHMVLGASNSKSEDTLTSFCGAVYVGDNMATSLTKLYADTPVANEWMGTSVSLTDTYLYAGAFKADSFVGAVYIYNLSDNTQATRLVSPTVQAGLNFGLSIDTDTATDKLVVGERGYDGTSIDCGGWYQFNSDGTVNTVGSLTGSGAVALGTGTIAEFDNQVALGTYNIGTDVNSVLEVGIGTSDLARANALVVYGDGTAELPESTIALVEARGPKGLVTNESIDNVVRSDTSLIPQTAVQVNNHVIMTQANYDLLVAPDAQTAYLIVG